MRSTAKPDGGLRVTVAAWVGVMAVVWVTLAALGYGSRDADSRLYAEMAARMAQSPAAGWIAPDFPPGWYISGPFLEHPVGLFVPAAILARLGYPAGQAAYAMNALYQAATLVLLPALAARLASGLEARTLGWLLQLLPIAFTYRVRANHEPALLLCLVLALLGTEKSRKSPSWMLLVCGGLVGMLLVKGLFAALGPPLCALWLLTTRSDGSPDAPKARPAWLGLAVAVVAMAGAAAAYEMLHRQATGEPFWSLYVSRQLGVAAAAGESGGELGNAALRKVSNLAWYLGRVLWFAFPWSVALLAAAVRLWLPRQESPRQAEAERSAAGAVAFVAGALLLYLGVFSLFDRRADRYVFPAYYLVGSAGAVAGVRRWPALRRVAERLDRPWVPAAVFLLTFAAHVLAGRLGVPTVKIDP